MQAGKMLMLYLGCQRELKTAKGAECSKCPLSKEVKLSMEAETPGTGVVSQITIQINPCLLVTQIASKL